MEILKLFAIIAELAAKAGAGSASMAGCHQPTAGSFSVGTNRYVG